MSLRLVPVMVPSYTPSRNRLRTRWPTRASANAVSYTHSRRWDSVSSGSGDDRAEVEGDVALLVLLLRCWSAVTQSSTVPLNSCRGCGPRLERRRTSGGEADGGELVGVVGTVGGRVGDGVVGICVGIGVVGLVGVSKDVGVGGVACGMGFAPGDVGICGGAAPRGRSALVPSGLPSARTKTRASLHRWLFRRCLSTAPGGPSRRSRRWSRWSGCGVDVGK